MKTRIIHLTDGSTITLKYAEGYYYHPDLENGHLVSYGRFVVKSATEWGYMDEMRWSPYGDLDYIFRRIGKDGRDTGDTFTLSANEIGYNFKARGLRVEVKS